MPRDRTTNSGLPWRNTLVCRLDCSTSPPMQTWPCGLPFTSTLAGVAYVASIMNQQVAPATSTPCGSAVLPLQVIVFHDLLNTHAAGREVRTKSVQNVGGALRNGDTRWRLAHKLAVQRLKASQTFSHIRTASIAIQSRANQQPKDT